MAKGIYKRGKDKETSKEVITKILRRSLTHSTPFRLLSIFFFVLLITGISYAEPIEFKGFIMGMPKEEVEIKARQEKGAKCRLGACNYKETIRDKDVDVYLFWGSDSYKLDLILMQFDSRSYQVLRDALIEKYGQPHNTNKELLQNMMGAVFENEIVEWKLKEGVILINKYGKTIKEGMVHMQSSAYLERKLQEYEKRKALPGF